MVLCELLEDGLVGGIAGLGLLGLADVEPQLLEEYGSQLLGGIDVELLPRQLEDLGAQLVDLLAQLGAHLLQQLAVELAARVLHAGEHGHQRQLHAVEQLLCAVFGHGTGKRLDQGLCSGSLEGSLRGGIVALGLGGTQVVQGEL